jgi:benzil reductase ((S)-benzoin forming)
MRKAIVTGHTRGIGAAMAEDLIARGFAVMGIARSRGSSRAEEHQLDLADTAALGAWLRSGALERFTAGAQSVYLINNAGLLQPIGPLQSQDVTAIGAAIAVNVAAAFMMSAAIVQATPKARDRRILHISSAAATLEIAGWSIYGGSKAAMDQHARNVVMDNTPNLRICSVYPGVVDTAMQTEIRATDKDVFPDRARYEELHRRGKLQQPKDVARRLIDFLVSDDFGSEPVVDKSPPMS